MRWAARINNALEESRFELFRMTIQPLHAEEMSEHFELLLRKRDESGKIAAPDQFIAAAERHGITPSMDRWVIDSAFRWLVSEADERRKLTMRSINEIGHLTGKQTIAEWAENAEIIEVLRGLGVDDAQGYGVSQPQKVQRAAIA
jgi:EAL domain-containing protein (putative c-di-GMP-specific phosphodiesterase class I)